MNKHRKNTGKSCLVVWKFILLIMAFAAVVSLVADAAAWIISLMGGFSFATEAATIGIIGGADGPTAVFVTSSVSLAWQIILKIIILTFSILGLKYLKQH